MPIPIDNTRMQRDDYAQIVRRLPRLDGHPRDPEDVDVWVTAGTTEHWTRAQVIAGLAALNSTFTGYRVMPGHLTEKIHHLRERVRVHWRCPDPPRDLADDPAAEIAWRGHAHRDYVARAMLALAAGNPLADVPMLAEPDHEQPVITGRAEQLRELTEHLGTRKTPPAEPGIPAPRNRDPARMTEARAQLDAIRDPDRADRARAELDERRPAETA